MNISIKLNKVQQEQLKEVMKRERKVFTSREVSNFFIDKINHIYLMEEYNRKPN